MFCFLLHFLHDFKLMFVFILAVQDYRFIGFITLRRTTERMLRKSESDTCEKQQAALITHSAIER